MANLQIRLDDNLKEQAQAVAADIGLDLSSAIRVFLMQMVRENRLPFQPGSDPFYTESNLKALRLSLAELQKGETVTKSMEQLRSLDATVLAAWPKE